MEDSLEKITINIDTDTATFINNSEFYIDIIEDIKNCIYIKTLKTEIFVKEPYQFKSKYDGISYNIFNNGNKIYMKLTTGDYDLDRHIVPSKELVPLTFQNVLPDANDKRDFFLSNGIIANLDLPPPPSEPQILYTQNNGAMNRTFLTNLPTNFYIKNEYNTINKYYDIVEIDKGNIISTGGNTYQVFSKELSGTSCGPNDTNTYKLNPILPELRRFNLQFFYKNEDGKHVPLNIDKNKNYTNTVGVFKINISFTVYFNRKKITRA